MRRRRLTPPPPPPTPPSTFAFASHARYGAGRRQRRGEEAADARGGGARCRRRHGPLPVAGLHCLLLLLRRRRPPPRPPLPSARHARPGARRRRQQQSDARRALAVALGGGAHQRQGQVLRHPRRRLLRPPRWSFWTKIPHHWYRRVHYHRHRGPLWGTYQAVPSRPAPIRHWVVLVSGTFSQVMVAMELLLEKLLNQGDQAIDSQYTTVVLVVPQACCGQLIGKGGSVIRSLTEVSEAEIQVSPKDTCYGSNDSLVSIRGPLDNQLQALFLILFMLLENFNYTFRYAAPMPDTSVGSPDDDSSGVKGILTIGVADEYVGAVIGRAGRTIKEI